jgi:hypothetical protein
VETPVALAPLIQWSMISVMGVLPSAGCGSILLAN